MCAIYTAVPVRTAASGGQVVQQRRDRLLHAALAEAP